MLRLKIFLCVAIAGCFIVSNAAAQQPSAERQPQNTGGRITEMVEKFLKEINREFLGGAEADTIPNKRLRTADKWERDNDEDYTYEGDTVIEEDEVVKGNIVVKGGDLTVYGEIDGDVFVVGGTLYVKDGGLITGDARVISGDIVKEDGGVIEGTMDRSSARSAGYREPRERFRMKSPTLSPNG
ncbi:MAG TPA: polymer-forming cytoskeletal protein [Bacteroidota bacterium]